MHTEIIFITGQFGFIIAGLTGMTDTLAYKQSSRGLFGAYEKISNGTNAASYCD